MQKVFPCDDVIMHYSHAPFSKVVVVGKTPKSNFPGETILPLGPWYSLRADKKERTIIQPQYTTLKGKCCHFDDILVTVGTGSCQNVCYSRLHFFSSHVFVDSFCNRPILQIPQCICSISYNAPFRTEMCTFLFWMVHCGIWNWCAVGFVN